jgi:uncharacterized protein YndB with AHSA1/START domain
MGCWREQALIDAPLEKVWELIGDPHRYPEWADEFIEVTGLPQEIQQGQQYEQVTRGPLRNKARTTFEIEQLDDLREIRLRCTASGWYSHWKLTEAGGGTFVDAEVGMEPINAGYKAVDSVVGKRWYRRVAQSSMDGLKRALGRQRSAAA